MLMNSKWCERVWGAEREIHLKCILTINRQTHQIETHFSISSKFFVCFRNSIYWWFFLLYFSQSCWCELNAIGCDVTWLSVDVCVHCELRSGTVGTRHIRKWKVNCKIRVNMMCAVANGGGNSKNHHLRSCSQCVSAAVATACNIETYKWRY